MSNNIHSTAIIDDSVKLGKNNSIGAYTVISGDVELGDNNIIHNHVNITATGSTKIGDNNEIFPFSSIGTAPQDLKFDRSEKTFLEIGNGNKIREHVTINPGTTQDNSLTKIGNNCLFMMASHIAHDCIVGNEVILANNATLAGHVQVGDQAIIGGLSAIHQFARIGNNAMIGGMSGIEGDVIPYGMAFGERAHLQGLNLVGMKRKQLDRQTITTIRKLFDDIFKKGDGKIEQRVENLKDNYKDSEESQKIIDFVINSESRSICQMKK